MLLIKYSDSQPFYVHDTFFAALYILKGRYSNIDVTNYNVYWEITIFNKNADHVMVNHGIQTVYGI